MYKYLAPVLGLIVCWRVIWLVIYWVFGFHVGYLSINNGVSFNNVILKRGSKITASSVRLRLWGNTRKLVISDLHITLAPGSGSKGRNVKSKSISENPLSIFPSSKISQILVRTILYLFRSVDIEFKQTTLKHRKFSVVANSIQLLVGSHISAKHPRIYNFNSSITILQTDARLTLSSNGPNFLSVGSFTISLCLSVDKTLGTISDVSIRVFLDDVELHAFQIIKNYILLSKTGSHSGSGAQVQSPKAENDNIIRIYRKFTPCFKELSITFAFCRVTGLPLIPVSPDFTLTEYFDSPEGFDSVYVSVESMSVHLDKLSPASAGYDIHFSSIRDVPIHVTFSSSLIKAGFETALSSGALNSDKIEFLSVPNTSFTFKTNAVRNLVDGLGFDNCVLEFFSSGNSPVFDVDHYQLSILMFNCTVWRKIFALRKLGTTAIHVPEDAVTSSNESQVDMRDHTGESMKGYFIAGTTEGQHISEPHHSSPFTKAIGLLKEYLPHIDVKLTVEQPRIIVRAHGLPTDVCQMLIISYSLMVFRFATSENQEYFAECQFVHPSLTFSEKSETISPHSFFKEDEEVLGLADVKLILNISKDLSVKTKLKLNGFRVKLSKPDALNGLHDIIGKTATSMTQNSNVGLINAQCDQKLLQAQQVLSQTYSHIKVDSTDHQAKLLKPLPSWFASFDFKIEDIECCLGSASPLLPPEYIAELSKSNKQSFAETESFLKFQISNFEMKLEDSANDYKSGASSTISLSHASSSSETLAEDTAIQKFWAVLTSIDGIKLSFFNESRYSSIISLPHLTHKISASSENQAGAILQECVVQSININLDRHKLFTAFGSAYLISQTIISPLQKLHKGLKKNAEILQPSHQPRRDTRLQNLMTSCLSIERIDATIALSDEFKVRLQNYNLILQASNGTISASNRFTRVMVDSSTLVHYWDRVLCIDSLAMTIGELPEKQKVILDAQAIRFIQPHGFVVHKLFDNSSIFVKIAKHLASCLKSEKKETLVSPKESSPVVSPGIKLSSRKVSFTIEDDPFESELNYIFQLGLVEQRKRLEHLSLLEDRSQSKDSTDVSYESDLQSLYKFFEQSWIRKIGAYKRELAKEIDTNKDYLFGSECDLPESGYEKIKPYPPHAPLLSVIFMGMNLDLWGPRFSLQDLPDFIYQQGQGVPKDTKYNLMIPSYLRLMVAELRMDMRDYPLPLLYLPRAEDEQGIGRALKMEGHLIICESLVLDEKNLRKLKIQLTDATNKPSLQPNMFDKLVIEKSLSTVKLYTDMDVVFDSELPSRFVWGSSYQFGVQQIMLTVDQFSKPPIDPSPKLGFWDKLRLVTHGGLSIKTGKMASIEVAFKGGKDPYDLFGVSNGFVLRFEDSVNWKINHHHQSSRFFDISAGKVSWYVPNYLATPLTCWSRDSVNNVYLPDEESIVHSCHGYYLGRRPSGISSNDSKVCEKTVVELSGGVDFTVGFLLERFREDNQGLTSQGKPHYEVELFNPKYTESNHDSYKGFRSDRLHMSISLKAHTQDSYNTIHLSPGVFTQIFSWWRMFQGNMLLPIRKGILFQDFKKSQKFSKHLYSNQFLFDVKNLFISHVIQKETSDVATEDYGLVGLRAKVSQFLVDLHQKKEEVLDIHEDLSRHKKVMKMKFNLGQTLLNQIDLRTVEAQFHRDVYKQNEDDSRSSKESVLKIFDGDTEWFDTRDYKECFDSFHGKAQSARIHPFLYSETFAYLRDTTKDTGSEEVSAGEIHDCVLHKTEHQSSEIDLYKRRLDALQVLSREGMKGSDESVLRRIQALKEMINGCKSARDSCHRKNSLVQMDKIDPENFHNRFLLVSMFLKWNEHVRNQFMNYIHFVNLKSIHRKFMSFEFIRALEEMIETNDCTIQSSLESSFSGSRLTNQALMPQYNPEQSSQERFNMFDEILRSVCEGQQILENYKIEIISPQIQLHARELKDAVVMVTAPSLESKIVSVASDTDGLSPQDSTTTEKRYGVILHDASVMVIDRDDIEENSAAFETKPYGAKSRWPPFLGIETCKNHEFASQDNVLVKQMSLMLTYQQQVASSSGFEPTENSFESELSAQGKNLSNNSADKLRVDIPRVSINCTSKQYFTLYATILGLLLYVEPLAAELREKVSKLNFSIDFQDFHTLHQRLVVLHGWVGITTELLKNYSFRQVSDLNNERLNEYLSLASRKESLETEIVLMHQTLFSGDPKSDSSSRIIQDWRIAADEIVLHMLNDDRTPIVDLSIAHGTYRRTVKEGGSNDNQVQIMNIEGLTLLPNSHFKRFLEPMEAAQKKHLIKIDWSMNQAIGGIKLIENFDISTLPLHVRIDEETGRSLVRFLFRQSEEEEISESLVFKLADQAQPDSEYDEEESEEFSSNKTNVNDESHIRSEMLSTSKESSVAASSKKFLEDDVNTMVSRSKKYLSIAKLTSQSFQLMISLRMKKGVLKWLNVTNFLLVLPHWKIEGKILSLLEVVNHLKSIVIKALVSHSGALLKNKLTSRSKNLKRIKKRLESSRLPSDAYS